MQKTSQKGSPKLRWMYNIIIGKWGSRALTKAMAEWVERTGVCIADVIQGRMVVESQEERPRSPGRLPALGLGARVDIGIVHGRRNRQFCSVGKGVYVSRWKLSIQQLVWHSGMALRDFIVEKTIWEHQGVDGGRSSGYHRDHQERSVKGGTTLTKDIIEES